MRFVHHCHVHEKEIVWQPNQSISHHMEVWYSAGAWIIAKKEWVMHTTNLITRRVRHAPFECVTKSYRKTLSLESSSQRQRDDSVAILDSWTPWSNEHHKCYYAFTWRFGEIRQKAVCTFVVGMFGAGFAAAEIRRRMAGIPLHYTPRVRSWYLRTWNSSTQDRLKMIMTSSSSSISSAYISCMYICIYCRCNAYVNLELISPW